MNVYKENYIIRKMTEDEVNNVAIEWAAGEGWNPGLHDASCFYAADTKGFYVGLLDYKPVACISVVAYDESFAFLGFYIVKPEYRGKGYGLRIWNYAINNYQKHNVGLDGVIAQKENYMKSGFKFAYRNIRYEGTAQETKNKFSNIIPVSKVPFNQIVDYDSQLFPSRRFNFLECWVKQPDSLALAALHDGKVSGYSVIRKCRTGYKVGPLFADTNDIAEELLLASFNFASPGSKIYLDTPEINFAAVQLAEKYGMQRVFETARMYTKSEPEIDLNKIFGVTTFELG